MLVCGIDEAGRGPVIGPMVMAGVLVESSEVKELSGIGVKDSKLLSQKRREELFDQIISIVKDYSIIIIEPQEIDAALMSESLNLNWLEAHNSAKIINMLKPDKIIIDSPSNNVEKYGKYLIELLENKKVEAVVEHKADLNHPECSAASILAKVTREKEIAKLKKEFGNFGSGYPSDPLTVKFMKENFRKHSGIFRKTWAPYRALTEGKKQKNLNEFEVEK